MIRAILCGIYGALASVFGKLALSDNLYLDGVAKICANSAVGDKCEAIVFMTRASLFGIMLLLNAAMVGSFLKSMERNASVVVTVLSTGSNYVVTGFLGRFLFQEVLGSWWIVGSTAICFGMCLIGISQEGLPKLRAR